MKKIYLTCSLSIFYTISLLAQTEKKDTLLFNSTPWETSDIGNGITWQHYHFKDKQLFNANENVHILRFKNKNKNAQLTFASAGDSLMLTSELAHQSNAIAAINGTFFDVKKGGSVDFIKINGQILDTTVHNIKKLAGHQQAAIAIKRNRMNIVKARDSLDFQWVTKLKYKDVMVTGPLLIWDNQPIPLSKSAFNDNRHPRTCACVTNKNEVILMTIDGRTAESYGVSLPELTILLQQLNCKNAINLDGGGSTTMWQEGKGIVNMPCDNKKFDHEGERKVSNILILKKR
jgi:exopolysaccharide biosynthesis protein